MTECENLIKNDGRELRLLIKGHFLTNGVINFLRKETSKRGRRITSLTIDHVYTGTIDCCKSCSVQDCYELEYMVYRLKTAHQNITNHQT